MPKKTHGAVDEIDRSMRFFRSFSDFRWRAWAVTIVGGEPEP
jgi:hypothetical protein